MMSTIPFKALAKNLKSEIFWPNAGTCMHLWKRVGVRVYLQGAEGDEDVGHDSWERHQDATEPR